METDEMQLDVSTLRDVGKRIVEMTNTHKLAGKTLYNESLVEKMLEENFYSSSFEFSIIIRLKIPINRYCLYRILSISLYPKIELMIKISHSRIKAIIKKAYCLKKTVRFFYEQN